MTDEPLRVYYDFTDPLSFLVAHELAHVPGVPERTLRWIPFEMRPPPTPLVLVSDAGLASRWSDARRHAAVLGVDLAPGGLVPWTRKAHELMEHASASGAEPGRLRSAIFEAFLLEGRDIGRVDVLVGIAERHGLDTTETRAVLDVDRYSEAVTEARDAAMASGVTVPPTLVHGDRLLQGFHNRTALGTFLGT